MRKKVFRRKPKTLFAFPLLTNRLNLERSNSKVEDEDDEMRAGGGGMKVL